MSSNLNFISPGKPLAPGVRVVSTCRAGGVSQGVYHSLNLGGFCDDDASLVQTNRARLLRSLKLDVEPVWLQQVHGTDIVNASQARDDEMADGIYSESAKAVCAITTADCLPIVLASSDGGQIMAIHAGWRGLAAGIIERAVTTFSCQPRDLRVWIGPGIGSAAFEIGNEVRQALQGPAEAYRPSEQNTVRWMANLPVLAKQRFAELDVTAVQASGLCTYTEVDRFFSFRRDGQTGRMATLIWKQ